MEISKISSNLPQNIPEVELDSPEPEPDPESADDHVHESSQFEGDEDDSEVDSSLVDQTNPDRYSVARDRQPRARRLPQRYSYLDLVAYALSSASEVTGEEPLAYDQVVSAKDSDKWVEAMQSKIASLKKNQIWKLVERPKGQRVVSC